MFDGFNVLFGLSRPYGCEVIDDKFNTECVPNYSDALDVLVVVDASVPEFVD